MASGTSEKAAPVSKKGITFCEPVRKDFRQCDLKIEGRVLATSFSRSRGTWLVIQYAPAETTLFVRDGQNDPENPTFSMPEWAF